ncbi:MAG: glucosidase [Planctomycetes bacterium]|nr:glucosidase [Planctomycetota bacterium]
MSRPIENAEVHRLQQDQRREQNWKRWGPYLSERQWGTVREDYSASGDCWSYLPHDHARSRAYRWGEDGLLGITDRECRLCFGLALWNGNDPILKERLFGLTGPEGNHGEDCKENYFYLDATPTHSYLRGLYQYPQAAYPYAQLVHGNRARGLHERELELADTGVLADGRYFDVAVEYAKASPDDVLVRITIHNRGPDAANLHVLPQLWFRNTWSWGRSGEGYWSKPSLRVEGADVLAEHETLGRFVWSAATHGGQAPELMFTENESNVARLWGAENPQPYVKDAFHRRVVDGETGAVNPARTGTKVAAWYRLALAAGAVTTIELRLRPHGEAGAAAFGPEFDRVFAQRLAEADAFHHALAPAGLSDAERSVHRQANAGLLWSKQFYHFDVAAWLEGDPAQPPPPAERRRDRNHEWTHLYNRDVVSMPDKWEYPWYAAWDLAFHMLPFARLDPQFAKDQLLLMLREWYMHPNGQLPAYEFAFGDVNPPVHAWACWRVYKMTGKRGSRDRVFLGKAFQKLLINFTWWVNRKDEHGKHLFAGGFLGLDNIGVFDRSRPLPTGGHLEQADGTAWMAFYCATMLSMALELASEDPTYEDVASKFFEHFVAITAAMNTLGGTGLWDEGDGFYYDQIHLGTSSQRLKVRSMVGLIPLFACEILEQDLVERLPGFHKRMQWFLEHRPHLARHVTLGNGDHDGHGHLLLAIPSQDRLVRVLRYLLDETEFLSPYGVRSLSAVHRDQPFVITVEGQEHRVDYEPGEGNTRLFGGNSNWRGPIWFPVNYLLVEALERYHHFFGDDLKVECPTGSGQWLTLQQVADELNRRLVALFLPDAQGRRPCHGGDTSFTTAAHRRDLVLFHEYFDGDTGRGCGASHQTGWTALVARCLENRARSRDHDGRDHVHADDHHQVPVPRAAPATVAVGAGPRRPRANGRRA